MDAPIVVYYGPANVASDVFRTYILRLGFSAQVTFDFQELLNILRTSPASACVLAAPVDATQLIELAREIRQQVRGPNHPIYILAPKEFDAGLSYVEVIAGRNALKRVADRILKWARCWK